MRRTFLAASLAITTLTLSGCLNIKVGEDSADVPAPVPVTPHSKAASAPASTEEPAPAQETAEPSPAPTVVAEAPAPTQPAQPAPSPAQAAPPAQSGANFGVNCGTSSTGLTTIVIAEANPAITCDEAHGAMNGFNEQYFATGSIGPFASGAYTCLSRVDADREFENRSVTCTRPGVRLEAMSFYPLGGSPISDNAPLGNGQYAPKDLSFNAHNVGCIIYEKGALWCLNGEDNPDGSTPTIMMGKESTQFTRKDMTEFGVSNSFAHEVPVGQVITSQNIACLNDGTSLICSNGTTSVRMNSSSFGR